MLGEYVRAYDAGVLQVPGLLPRLPHGGPGGDHPVLGLLGAHGVAPATTLPCPSRVGRASGAPDPISVSAALATLARLHFRHSGAGGETDVVIIVLHLRVIREARTSTGQRRQCDRPATRSADHGAAAAGLFTFLHVNYRSLAAPRHI